MSYLHHVSPTSDNFNAGSLKRTFETVQKATDAVAPDDTAHIDEGTPIRSGGVKVSGEEDRCIVFESEHGAAGRQLRLLELGRPITG
jgi:hypothetical protein